MHMVVDDGRLCEGSICWGTQLQGWCQAMCLNRARQRRRHRRAIEDWAFLHQHALNAEASPDFAAWLPGSGWAWQGEQAAPVRLPTWESTPRVCGLCVKVFLPEGLFCFLVRISSIV